MEKEKTPSSPKYHRPRFPKRPDEHVLEICDIPSSIDVERLKTEVTTYIRPREAFYIATGRSFYIEDEFSEYWMALASKGEQIGKGSGGMDVRTGAGEGVDVMCVVMGPHHSNEKSLMQNFSESGADLDTYFKEKNDNLALALFRDGYEKKIRKTKEEKNLNNLYIIAFISNGPSIHLACFKLNLDKIKTIASAGFVGDKEKCVNIKIDNFIPNELGYVLLYKSKKRMELRLNKTILENSKVVKLY
jgi:hypothetical protein